MGENSEFRAVRSLKCRSKVKLKSYAVFQVSVVGEWDLEGVWVTVMG